jgi:aspartate aminotransferase-like enzyme
MLWIPGPTEVRAELLAECARPTIGHRSKHMTELIERLDPGLRLAFGLAENSSAHVAVHSASATAMMEGGLLGAGRRTLSIVNGAFSKRWFQIAGLLGKDAHKIDVAWGDAIDPAELRRVLTAEGPFDAVTLVSNETSTGTRTPLALVADVLDDFPDTLLLVDLVSYIAGAPVDFDANRIDFGFAGVQKAFALPPGVVVMCASDKYMGRAAAQENRGFYLDPIRIVEGHAKRKTPATPCITLYYALARQLEDISNGVTLPAAETHKSGAEAWTARFEKHERMRDRTIAWAASHGLEPFPKREFVSPTVACINAGSLDVASFVAGLAERDFQISNGYGDLKGKTFRIGHMGDHTEEGLEALLSAADQVLATQPV